MQLKKRLIELHSRFIMKSNNKTKKCIEVTVLPMLMAVSCLSPVKTQTLMLAAVRLAIVSGTP